MSPASILTPSSASAEVSRASGSVYLPTVVLMGLGALAAQTSARVSTGCWLIHLANSGIRVAMLTFANLPGAGALAGGAEVAALAASLAALAAARFSAGVRVRRRAWSPLASASGVVPLASAWARAGAAAR